MRSLQTIPEAIRSLSDDEKQVIKAELIDRFPHTDKNPDQFMADERFGKEGLHCPHCSGVHIRKNGHSYDGRQRYICVDCHRTFNSSTKTLLAGTHKETARWENYINCMFEEKSLRVSARECGISLPTAFAWRHKILDSLRCRLGREKVGGVVEADETYVNVSYKGNHSRSSSFSMPRESRKRGGEVHQSGLSRELVCISCAISQDGRSLASALTLGRPSEAKMDSFFCGKTEDGTVLCTDFEPTYSAFARKNSLRHIQVERNQCKDGYSIQRINAYHSRLKGFLSGFRGVSTKYLDNYLAWNTLRDRISLRGAEEEASILMDTFLAPVDTLFRTMRDRPAVPDVNPV